MGLLGCYPQGESSQINDQWERSGTVKYIAAFTSDCRANYVRSNLGSGLIINAPHPDDAGQVVAGIGITQIEEPSQFNDPTNSANALIGTGCFWWQVDVSYGPWNPLTHTATGDPADQPVDYSFDWQVFEQACDFAYNPSSGLLEPVLNSAGDPFDPPVTREQQKGVLRVAYNSHTFSPPTLFAFGNMINSDTWNGFAPFTVKFSPPKMPQRLYSQFLGINYFRLESEFGFNPNDAGWNAYPIDRGYRGWNGSNQYKILDVNGQPISQPALLNGSGVPLNNVSGSGFYQFNWQIYKSIAFNTAFPNLSSLW